MVVNKDKFSKNLQSNTNVRRIGYPRVEQYPYTAVYGFQHAEYLLTKLFSLNESEYRQLVLSEIIDMDDPEVPQTVKDNIEFEVDLTDYKLHLLSYQLKKNESRAEEAKRIRQQVLYQDRLHNNTERIDKDVLIMYMDNISRAHFHRKMKKLNKWLDQYADDYIRYFS